MYKITLNERKVIYIFQTAKIKFRSVFLNNKMGIISTSNIYLSIFNRALFIRKFEDSLHSVLCDYYHIKSKLLI